MAGPVRNDRRAAELQAIMTLLQIGFLVQPRPVYAVWVLLWERQLMPKPVIVCRSKVVAKHASIDPGRRHAGCAFHSTVAFAENSAPGVKLYVAKQHAEETYRVEGCQRFPNPQYDKARASAGRR